MMMSEMMMLSWLIQSGGLKVWQTWWEKREEWWVVVEIYVVVKKEICSSWFKVTRGGEYGNKQGKLKPFLLFVSSGWGCAGALYSGAGLLRPGSFSRGTVLWLRRIGEVTRGAFGARLWTLEPWKKETVRGGGVQ
jgi:hypothetical protein